MATVLPDSLTTKLNAVNTLLQSISQAPVDTVDPTISPDVAAAVQTLDELDRRIQTKGWHWNREDDWELAPNEEGEIPLPSNYLWIGNAYWTEGGSKARVTERARKLYNRETRSFTFDGSVSLDMVLKLDWEDMPEYARQAILVAAEEVFQVRLQGTSIIERVAEKAIQGAYTTLEQREDEGDEQNSIGGNRHVSNLLYGTARRRQR